MWRWTVSFYVTHTLKKKSDVSSGHGVLPSTIHGVLPCYDEIGRRIGIVQSVASVIRFFLPNVYLCISRNFVELKKKTEHIAGPCGLDLFQFVACGMGIIIYCGMGRQLMAQSNVFLRARTALSLVLCDTNRAYCHQNRTVCILSTDVISLS